MEVRAEAAQVDRARELGLERGAARLDGDEQRVGQVRHQREVALERHLAAEVVAQRAGERRVVPARTCARRAR